MRMRHWDGCRATGWVKTELPGAHDVYGIVRGQRARKIELAVRATCNVFLFEYQIDFRLMLVVNGPNAFRRFQTVSKNRSDNYWHKGSPGELLPALERIHEQLQLEEKEACSRARVLGSLRAVFVGATWPARSRECDFSFDLRNQRSFTAFLIPARRPGTFLLFETTAQSTRSRIPRAYTEIARS